MKKSPTSTVAGVLPIIKPVGPTSHDVVQIARRALQERQIGHTGTLDPAAGGVLVLCVGPYTKLVPYLTECDKIYTGHIGLGVTTDTDDAAGKVIATGDAFEVTEEQIRDAAAKLTGKLQQMPPRYAAIKVAGRKLYEYAREGTEVEIAARSVTVHEFATDAMQEILVPESLQAASPAAALPEKILRVPFRAHVSSGTYIRSLARDLGEALGCGGTLLTLFRDAVGSFTAESSVSLESLKDDPDHAAGHALRGAAAIDSSRYACFTLSVEYEQRLFIGQPLNEHMFVDKEGVAALRTGEVCAVVRDDGALLAMMQADRFEEQRRLNPYDSRFQVHLRPLRVFPGGLK